ncbi:PspA/IM30 family protein [Riemerella anatipestifer]|uniref:Phage shock protein A (IM30), suppresses sigma54-dependent transcription n=1 Tax=Riemerella anatipestifer RA-CH-1 TaxID=1228997 RepID=J9QZL9_RIEAN|nr:PspA/IM30 family protein [Riemerella anatipestifer]AFR34874.1 Phage shock protein A (IM30), suppresses sigma54-dependent transcription [Riemerella anatipestifer RA-CH-1]AGC41289.1 Phage shock protein A (IM30), suppresses sigma54-dependent transcription [Riemerella anatipestifer RA-CH-2]AIH01877.1 phage shock protein a, pspa [Riemerella anatipestifer CH3]AKP71900.1 phage shock protein A (IM30), suppresses sigma54-dependent transcription [Riemerella anatipestifer]MBT0562199.1 PspA/IM30 family
MNILKRLFRIGNAETHAAIDKLEDPIKMTEQGIREMKDQLSKSIDALAQVKALAIRRKNEQTALENQAEEYQSKAIILVQKGMKEEMPTEEADRLAKEALKKKELSLADSKIAETDRKKLESDVEKMQANINTLKSNIAKWESELKTLKARVQVSQVTKDINQKMSQLSNDSTIGMLEKMKEKVLQQEAVADAYGEIANASKSIDEEINQAADTSNAKAETALAALKEQLKNS